MAIIDAGVGLVLITFGPGDVLPQGVSSQYRSQKAWLWLYKNPTGSNESQYSYSSCPTPWFQRLPCSSQVLNYLSSEMVSRMATLLQVAVIVRGAIASPTSSFITGTPVTYTAISTAASMSSSSVTSTPLSASTSSSDSAYSFAPSLPLATVRLDKA